MSIDDKTNIKEFVEKNLKKLNIELTSDRKRIITASLVQTVALSSSPMTEDALFNILVKLANRKHEGVMSYTEGTNKCVRCKKNMEPVLLHNSRKAHYCHSCRIAVPKLVKEE